jgi:Domain of unknown function (DUF4260)
MANARTALPDAGHDKEGGLLLRPDLLVRLEGLVALVLAVWWYAAHVGSWVPFAVLFLAPDIAMLGYLGGPRVGAAAYNLVHTYTTAGIVAGVGLVTHHRLLLYLAFILTAHIGVDRLLAFGLKYPSGFNDTHLQRL